ncbi:hypothetical protein BS78_01G297600 [Paspalum vaginatum]|nr:hypothetical protein BS78_01G297600 [Paspalum vaginatum]
MVLVPVAPFLVPDLPIWYRLILVPWAASPAVRVRDASAKTRALLSSAVGRSAPPAIALFARGSGVRSWEESGAGGGGVRRYGGQTERHGAVRVAAGVGFGGGGRWRGAEGVPGAGAGAAVSVLHLPALRRHARLLAQVQENLISVYFPLPAPSCTFSPYPNRCM